MQIFENTEIAFRHRSYKELKKAAMLFRLMHYPGIMKISGAIARTFIRLNLPAKWLVNPIIRHFCGGENLEESASLVDFLSRFNVFSVLDYAAENRQSEAEIRSVIEEVIRTMDFAKRNPDVLFSVFKPSALAPVEVLEKANSFYSSDSTSADGQAQGTENFRNNIRVLCQSAFERGIPVMIDAEESYYQDVVDGVAREMMELYNREKAIVFNTIQMYRHDRLDFLHECIRHSRQNKYHLGLKIVRGAYMDQERLRAIKMGYPSPIYPDKKSTDAAFDSAVSLSLQNIDSTSIFAGTHNEDSMLFLMEKMKEHGLKKNDQRIYVSQLYGMSDHISFNMAYDTYNVVKYIPYGPVNYLLPYLIRRAEENKSVAGQAGRELHYINLEIQRRNSIKKEKSWK